MLRLFVVRWLVTFEESKGQPCGSHDGRLSLSLDWVLWWESKCVLPVASLSGQQHAPGVHQCYMTLVHVQTSAYAGSVRHFQPVTTQHTPDMPTHVSRSFRTTHRR